MERNFYDDEFEDFLKQKADLYSLYPSERVWNGIYRSLHSRRKWYTATGILFLITTMLFISIEIVSTKQPVSLKNSSAIPASLQHIANASLARIALADNNKPSTSNTDNTVAITNNKRTRNNIPTPTRLISSSLFEHSLLSGAKENAGLISASRVFIPLAAPSIALSKAPAVEEKREKVNWLRDMATIRISPFKNKHLQLQFYVSPGASYRRLNTFKSELSPSNTPSLTGDLVNVDGIVDQQPAFGLEAGSAVLVNLSDHFVLKGGLQLNFVRYNIKAYKSAPERTAITLSSVGSSNSHETITAYSSLRNQGGRIPQALENQYLQISLPIGAEIKILGDKRLQLNVAGTLQPTYLLYNNTYLLSSDYGNYTKQPDLVRKWNVNAAVETYISYSVGGLRWQAGPQFRYQLLSSYSDRYPIREYLTEYGIKIGVTKTIK